MALDPREGVADVDDAGLQVDVLPAQGAYLADSHAGLQRDGRAGGERRAAEAVQGVAEAGDLGRRERVDGLASPPWRLHEVERIAADVTELSSPGKDLLEEDVGVREDRGGHSVAGEVLLPARDVLMSHVAHLLRAEIGAYEVPQVRAVAPRRHVLDRPGSLLVAYVVPYVVGDRQRGCGDYLLGGVLGDELVAPVA